MLCQSSSIAIQNRYLECETIKSRQLAAQQRAEKARPAASHEVQKIVLDKIIIAPKLSKFEYDQQRLRLSADELIKRYEDEHAPVERILQSHQVQSDALNTLRCVFAPHQFVVRGEITKDRLAKADLVVSFGGDNHFQYISHFIGDGFLIGVNSDPIRSEGALTKHSSDQFLSILNSLVRGDFKVEEWTRLEGKINGRTLPRVISEYFLGELSRLDMSRYILQTKDGLEEQKGSGLIVATGAGSTGWLDSEIADNTPLGSIFPRTERTAHLFVTAPYRGAKTETKIRHVMIHEGEEVRITSLNDNEGIVGCDAIEREPFGRGAVATIKLSDQPLKVLAT